MKVALSEANTQISQLVAKKQQQKTTEITLIQNVSKIIGI